MILYTVTAEVEAGAAPEWLAWMRQRHIPDVLATGCFRACRAAELREPAPPPGYVTYVLEYEAPDPQALARYRDQFAPALQRAHTSRYGNRVRASRSVRALIE